MGSSRVCGEQLAELSQDSVIRGLHLWPYISPHSDDKIRYPTIGELVLWLTVPWTCTVGSHWDCILHSKDYMKTYYYLLLKHLQLVYKIKNKLYCHLWEWIGIANLCQMKFCQLKFRQIKFAKWCLAKWSFIKKRSIVNNFVFSLAIKNIFFTENQNNFFFKLTGY